MDFTPYRLTYQVTGGQHQTRAKSDIYECLVGLLTSNLKQIPSSAESTPDGGPRAKCRPLETVLFLFLSELARCRPGSHTRCHTIRTIPSSQLSRVSCRWLRLSASCIAQAAESCTVYTRSSRPVMLSSGAAFLRSTLTLFVVIFIFIKQNRRRQQQPCTARNCTREKLSKITNERQFGS